MWLWIQRATTGYNGLQRTGTEGSFLLLPGWHAFCWWRLWNNDHYSCENSLEEVQGATTSSRILQPLLQDPWPCTVLACGASCSMPVKLGHWPRRTCSACSVMTEICSNKPEDVAKVMWSEQLAKLELEDLDLILREKAALVWARGAFKWCSQNSMWYTDWWQAGGGGKEVQPYME